MIPLLWASNFLPVMFSLDSQQPEAIQIILLKSTERGTTPRRDGISTLIPQRVNPTSSLRRGLATVPVAGRSALVGGSVQPVRRLHPGLLLVVRVPVALLLSGVRVWVAFFPRIGSVATVSVSLDYFPYGFKAVGIVPAKPVDFYRY